MDVMVKAFFGCAGGVLMFVGWTFPPKNELPDPPYDAWGQVLVSEVEGK